MDSLKLADPALHEKIVQECARIAAIAESDVDMPGAHVQNTSATHSGSAVDESHSSVASDTISRSDMSSTAIAVISTAPSAVHVTSLPEAVGTETGQAVSSSTETVAPCPANSSVPELEVDHTKTLVGVETAAAKEGDKDDAKDVATNATSLTRKRCVRFKQYLLLEANPYTL